MSEAESASVPSRKKTRRRLRVSCVECTRRRQKCDRQQPCGLCKSRGVEDFCRWELEPFARPPPARPPAAQRSGVSSSKRQSQSQSQSQPRTTSNPSIGPHPTLRTSASHSASSHTSASPDSVPVVDQDVKEAAIALAQLSVARHGEYLGAGSLVSALHRLDDSGGPEIPVGNSTGLPFFTSSQYSSAISDTFFNSLQTLISGFPDKLRCDVLVEGFFEHDSTHSGIPQMLILAPYNGMWDTIQADHTSLSRINFHWVTLLFAMFAVSPTCETEEESRRYFLQALTGKRLAEDLLCASFVSPRTPDLFTEGTAYGCIAASLIAKYMCDRGQLTEAWKLIGSALRNAQNAGMHLNPASIKWKNNSKEEILLRSLAWHLCALRDKFLSFLLGRPVMIRARDCDVPMFSMPSMTLASDGSSKTSRFYQAFMTTLIDIISEEKNKYLSVHPDLLDGSINFDAKMKKWEASLPKFLAFLQPDTSLDHVYPDLPLHRNELANFYFTFCMLFHRSLPCAQEIRSTGVNDGVDVNSARANPASAPTLKATGSACWDFEKLTSLAISILHNRQKVIERLREQRQIAFSTTLFIFEAGITLSIALLRDPHNPRAKEWAAERDLAINMLESVKDRDNGVIVQQAMLVLRVLQDRKFRGVGAGTDYISTGNGVTSGSGIQTAPFGCDPPLSASYLNTGSGLTWPALDNHHFPASMFQSTLPTDVLQSLDFPMEWLEDSLNGSLSVTAFDLLHNVNLK